MGSETASTVCTRGIYETDKLRNWVSAYDAVHPPWAELAEEWWKFYAAREWLSGGFAWTGFDYRGEPTPYGWPSINSQFGIVDMCGFPKDNFYYYKAWWGSEPVLHLFPHWNWEQREGEPISVWVHSNLDSVELFLNGKSQGSKKVEPLTHLEWSVKYEPGVLEARGTKDGKVVLVEKRETTGAPESIRLTADRTEIDADGEDVCVVRVEALDKEGRPIPTADNLITFKVGGEGDFDRRGQRGPQLPGIRQRAQTQLVQRTRAGDRASQQDAGNNYDRGIHPRRGTEEAAARESDYYNEEGGAATHGGVATFSGRQNCGGTSQWRAPLTVFLARYNRKIVC